LDAYSRFNTLKEINLFFCKLLVGSSGFEKQYEVKDCLQHVVQHKKHVCLTMKLNPSEVDHFSCREINYLEKLNLVFKRSNPFSRYLKLILCEVSKSELAESKLTDSQLVEQTNS